MTDPNNHLEHDAPDLTTQPSGGAGPMQNLVWPLAVLAVGALTVYIVQNEHWKGSAVSQLEDADRVSSDVSTALKVLGDHGTELQLIRTQIEGVRGQLVATRLELLENIRSNTDGRFRASDWSREKQVIDLQFKAVENQLESVSQAIRALEKKIGN